MSFRLTPSAAADLTQIKNYLLEQNPDIAARVVDDIQKTLAGFGKASAPRA